MKFLKRMQVQKKMIDMEKIMIYKISPSPSLLKRGIKRSEY